MEERPSRVLAFVVLVATWLGTGFTLGTLTLLGPVRWTTGVIRSRGLPEFTETVVVLSLILLLVVVSLTISYFVMRKAITQTRWWRTAGYPAATTVVALLALWAWLTPGFINRGGTVEELTGTRFTFGPYPTESDLRRLKAEGFTDVISLLHPAVVPFEPALLSREVEAAETAGINLIHTPMLPWLSENVESLERLRTVIQEGEGKYYVHCYLGRDRVAVVRRLVSRLSPPSEGLVAEVSLDDHPLATKDRFERGEIVRLDSLVFLTPYPTDEEFLSRILEDATGTVVSMLDPGSPLDVPWIEKERDALEQYAVPFVLAPIPLDPFEPERVLDLVERVRALDGYTIVHAFRDDSPAYQAFEQAYRWGRAPLPPVLFDSPLDGGLAEVVAGGVAVGPTPTPDELLTELPARGIRGYVYVGTATPPWDPGALTDAGLAIQSVEPGDPERLTSVLSGRGPWYVFGPSVDALRAMVADLGLERHRPVRGEPRRTVQ